MATQRSARAFDWFFNATLHEGSFRARSERFELGGIESPIGPQRLRACRLLELPLTVLADLLNRALAFFGEFMREHDEQRGCYRTNKVVAGRIIEGSEPVPVELLADPARGLYGFRAPPGESSDAVCP